MKVHYQKDNKLNAHILKQFIERNQQLMYHFILNPLITCSLPSSVPPGLRTHVLLKRSKWHYQGASKPADIDWISAGLYTVSGVLIVKSRKVLGVPCCVFKGPI
jgi:hypothetical protein